MNQSCAGGVGEKFLDYLLDQHNRHEIETALAVEFLLENAEQEHCSVYEQAMAVWEYMRTEQPELGKVVGEDSSTPHAITTFCVPVGEKITMKIEICAGKVRLRSMRGVPRARKQVEARWKSTSLPGSFLKKVSARHQAGRRQAATMQR